MYKAAVHLALQLGPTVRRTDDVCAPGLLTVHNVKGVGRVDEEFVFDVPHGDRGQDGSGGHGQLYGALHVNCLARQYHGKRR